MIDCIIKFGGSLLTVKEQFETLRECNLREMANFVKQQVNLERRFVVVHGAGSFGHHHAKTYNVNDGDFCDTEKRAVGFCKTRNSVLRLNNIVCQALNDVGVSAVSFQVFPDWKTDQGHLETSRLDGLRDILALGFVPVTHGDCVIDATKSYHVLSGDVIIQKIAAKLRPSKVIFVTDVKGIYDRNPTGSATNKSFIMQQEEPVILPQEAESFIDHLECFKPFDIGSLRWTNHHDMMEKLNMQAVVSASSNSDEFVKEFINASNKLPVIIHDLMLTEIWKEKVFDEFIRMEFEPQILFPIYMVIYHEATVCNLLETILFHSETAEYGGDAILDVMDYTYRKLTALVQRQNERTSSDEVDDVSTENMSSMSDLSRMRDKLEFDISVKCISILRYLVDHLSVLPLSATWRILNVLDVPLLLVELIVHPPWLRRRKDGVTEKYVDNKFQAIEQGMEQQLTKLEAQAWLALYQLLMNDDCQKKYAFDPHRKSKILQVRGRLTEVVLDQLPVLVDLRRYVEELNVMDPPPPASQLVIEQMPEIRDAILKENAGKWEKIARKQSTTCFNPDNEQVRAQAQKLAQTYSLDMLENLALDPPKCALCGELAAKRCSRCKNEWYCRRECQVSHWNKHKKACDLLVEAEKAIHTNAANKTAG